MEPDLHPHPPQLPRRIVPDIPGHVCNELLRRLQDDQFHFRKIDRGKIPDQGAVDQFPERARVLHPGRAPSHDDEGQKRLSPCRVRFAGRTLEAADDVVFQRDGLFEVFQKPGVLLDAGHAEGRGDAPRRHDQVVIGNRPCRPFRFAGFPDRCGGHAPGRN